MSDKNTTINITMSKKGAKKFSLLLVSIILILGVVLNVQAQGNDIIKEQSGNLNFRVVSLDPCIEVNILETDSDNKYYSYILQSVLNANQTCPSNYKTPVYFVNNTPITFDITLVEGQSPVPNTAQYIRADWAGITNPDIDVTREVWIWNSGGSLNQLPKWFGVKMNYDGENIGVIGTLYAGTATYGIELTDASPIVVITSTQNWQYGNALGAGGEGHIAMPNSFMRDDSTQNIGIERSLMIYPPSWTPVYFKTTGECDVQEAGAVRTIISCNDTTKAYRRIFNFKDSNVIYVETIFTSSAWIMNTPKLELCDEAIDGHVHYGDGTPDGSGDVWGGGDFTVTTAEGWFGLQSNSGVCWYAYVMNMNETSSGHNTIDDGDGIAAFYTGYSGGGMTIADGHMLRMNVLLDNQSLTETQIHDYSVDSFWLDDMGITFNTGAVTAKNYTATNIRFNGTHGITTVDVTLDPVSNAIHSVNDKIFIQSHNMSGVSNIYIYNHTGSSALVAGNLRHHYTLDTTVDNRWEYGASEPTYTPGNPISLGGNETQFCTATNKCSDAQTTVDTEFYFVTSFDHVDEFRISYTETEIEDAVSIEPLITLTNITEYQPDPDMYVPLKDRVFSTTVCNGDRALSDINNVWFYWNGVNDTANITNTTAINSSCAVFYKTISDLPANITGVVNYWFYADNTTGASFDNISTAGTFNITKAGVYLNLTVNRTQGSLPSTISNSFSIASGADMAWTNYLAENAFAYGDYVYVVGGFDDGIFSNSVKRYSISGNSWDTVLSMGDYGIREIGGALVNEKIYVFGGERETGESPEVWVYNISQNTWHLSTLELPSGNQSGLTSGCPYLDRYIFQFGGKAGAAQASSSQVFKYDTIDESFTMMTNVTNDIRDFAIACGPRYAYIIGGYRDVGGDQNTNYRYDMQLDSWDTMAPLPYLAREIRGGLINTDQVFVMGGLNTTDLDTIYIYNTSDNIWYASDFNLIQTARAAASSVLNNIIYLAGGYNAGAVHDLQIITGIENTGRYILVNTSDRLAVNITVWVNATGPIVNFNVNFTDWSNSSGPSPYENSSIIIDETPGVFFNATGWFDGNQNYTSSSSVSFYVNITERPLIEPSMIFQLGNSSPIEYGTAMNVSCGSSIGNVSASIFRDGVNITNENDTYVYWGAGTYNITCFGDGTGDYSDNQTDISFTINQALGNVQVYPLTIANIYDNDAPLEQYCEDNTTLTCTIYRNGIEITNGTTLQLAVGVYEYHANISDSQNYTGFNSTETYTLTQKDAMVQVYPLTVANTYEDDAPLEQYCYDNTTLTCRVYIDGVEITNGTTLQLAAGVYEYHSNISDSQNYTNFNSTETYTLNQKDAMVQVYPSVDITYEDGASLQYCTDNSTVYTCLLFRDTESVANGTSLEFGVGVYEFLANITDQVNYTNYENSNTFTVSQMNANVQVVPITQIQQYAYSATQDCTDDSVYYNCRAYRNASLLIVPSSYTPAVGVYYYSAEIIEDTVNYTDTGDNETLTISQGPLIANVYINGVKNEDTVVTDGIINATAECFNIDGIIPNLYRDGVYKGSSENIVLFEGNYTYKSNCTGNANYTTNSTGESRVAIVAGAPTIIIHTPVNNSVYALMPVADKRFNLTYSVNNLTSPVVCWISLSGQSNLSLYDCRNATIKFNDGAGSHWLTVYANESLGGNINFTTAYYTIDYTSTWNITGPDGVQLTSGSALLYNATYNFTVSTIDGEIRVNNSDLPYGNFTIEMSFPGYSHPGTSYYNSTNQSQYNDTISIGYATLQIRVFDENSRAPINWYKLLMKNSTTEPTGSIETVLTVGKGITYGFAQLDFLDGNDYTLVSNDVIYYTYEQGFTNASFSIIYEITDAGAVTNNITVEVWNNGAGKYVNVFNLSGSGNVGKTTANFTVNNSGGLYEDINSYCNVTYEYHFCPSFRLTMKDDGTASVNVYEIELQSPYVYDQDGFAEVNYTNFQLITDDSRFIFSSKAYAPTIANNFAQRTYLISPTTSEDTVLDAYLNKDCVIQEFVIYDRVVSASGTQNPLENVIVTVYRQYDTGTVVIAQERSDTTGIVDICVQIGHPYIVSFVKDGYNILINYDKIWTGSSFENVFLISSLGINFTNPYNPFVNITPFTTVVENQDINYTCAAMIAEPDDPNINLNNIFAHFTIWYLNDTSEYPGMLNLSTYPPVYRNNSLPFGLNGTEHTEYQLLYNISTTIMPGGLWVYELNMTGKYILECGITYNYTQESMYFFPGAGGYDSYTIDRYFTVHEFNKDVRLLVTVYNHNLAPAASELFGMINQNALYILALFITMITTSFFITKFGMRSGFLFLLLWAMILTIFEGWGFNSQTGLLGVGTLLWVGLMLYPFRRGN